MNIANLLKKASDSVERALRHPVAGDEHSQVPSKPLTKCGYLALHEGRLLVFLITY